MDPARLAHIAQKRKTLKAQITLLSNNVTQEKVSRDNALLRLDRLTDLFHNYEELHDELEIGSPENEGLAEFPDIQDNFYDLSTRINAMPGANITQGQSNPSGSRTLGPNNLNVSNPLASSTMLERQLQIKLPDTPIPKFDGDFNNWLSFKNQFLSLIDKYEGLSDLHKFLYLQNAMVGPAKAKLSLFTASAENYQKAWELLTKSYERKRILVTKHLDAFFDITPLKTPSSAGLLKLIDDTQQHLAMLKSLEVSVNDTFVIRWLERALPAEVRREWEKTLSLDELPELEKFSTFITDCAFRLSTDRGSTHFRGENSNKRSGEHQNRPHKFRKNESSVRSLVTSTNTPSSSGPTCPQCSQAHLLWQCPTFSKVPLSQRWGLVKREKLCQNCLRPGTHAGQCPSRHCKHCSKMHHSLLHSLQNNAKAGGKDQNSSI